MNNRRISTLGAARQRLTRRLSLEKLLERDLLAADIMADPFEQTTDPHDVSGDGEVTPLDALLVVNAIADEVHAAAFPEADVNNDQQIDQLDAELTMNAVASMMSSSPSSDPTCQVLENLIDQLMGMIEALHASLNQLDMTAPGSADAAMGLWSQIGSHEAAITSAQLSLAGKDCDGTMSTPPDTDDSSETNDVESPGDGLSDSDSAPTADATSPTDPSLDPAMPAGPGPEQSEPATSPQDTPAETPSTTDESPLEQPSSDDVQSEIIIPTKPSDDSSVIPSDQPLTADSPSHDTDADTDTDTTESPTTIEQPASTAGPVSMPTTPDMTLEPTSPSTETTMETPDTELEEEDRGDGPIYELWVGVGSDEFANGFDPSGTLYEGDYLVVAGKVDPQWRYDAANRNRSITIQADLNSDGEFDEVTETHTISHETIGFEGDFYFQFPVVDDGPSPGNGTPSDPIKVIVTLGEQRFTREITAYNVPPIFTQAPSLSRSVDADDFATTLLVAEFYDPGLLDEHMAELSWGDGSTIIVEDDDMERDPNRPGVKRFQIERPTAGSGRHATPIRILVTDDDTGTATHTIRSLDVALNNNDSDDNAIPDHLDIRLAAADPDLVELSLSDLPLEHTTTENGSFSLHYDPTVLRIWDSPEKTTLIVPESATPTNVHADWHHLYQYSTPIPVAAVEYEEQQTVWVEGIGLNTTNIAFTWTPKNTVRQALGPIILGSFQTNVWGIDVAIDSDNSEGFRTPSRTVWQQFIEDNDYAIGKMLSPEDLLSTPLTIQLPPGIDPSDSTIRVEIDWARLQTGVIRIVNHPFVFFNTPVHPISEGGQLVVPGKPNGYSLSELNYDRITGEIELWLQPLQLRIAHNNKNIIDEQGKPQDRLSATVSGLMSQPFTDQVKLTVADRYSFYRRMTKHIEIRSALASEMIYGRRDSVNFGLRLLTEPEVQAFLEGQSHVLTKGEINFIIDALFKTPAERTGPISASLNIGIYRNYNAQIHPDYILAFGGTETHDYYQILTNLTQLLMPGDISYQQALDLGNGLARTSLPFSITGHSLGGGLAAIATIGANTRTPNTIQAKTFNAAGIQEHTLLRTRTTPRQEYLEGSLATFANIESYVVNFGVNLIRSAPDILTFLQSSIPHLPVAVGTNIWISSHLPINEDEQKFLALLSYALRHTILDPTSLTPDRIAEAIVDGIRDAAIVLPAIALNPIIAYRFVPLAIEAHGFEAIHKGLYLTSYLRSN